MASQAKTVREARSAGEIEEAWKFGANDQAVTGRCYYCGHRCRGRVCQYHKDLPAKDWRGE